MDTAPLPTASQDPPRAVRAVELAAGLAGSGMLLLGVVLLVLQLLTPRLIDGAHGPGWGPVLAHLLVGGLAEGARGARRRIAVPARVAVAVLTILAVLAVLVFTWWR
ncbi:MAG: hypothetical protein M3Y77_14865 [Actinomycetota bacterium]|nr:hypothetical protein [Actinomycetota bacterium]